MPPSASAVRCSSTFGRDSDPKGTDAISFASKVRNDLRIRDSEIILTMKLDEKVAQAEYFLKNMIRLESEYQDHYHHFPDARPQAPAEQRRKLHFAYEFAAFLTAARSVVQYIIENLVVSAEAKLWFVASSREPIIRCFKLLRNVDVHVEMLSSEDAWVIGAGAGEYIGPYFIINNDALDIPQLANDDEAKRELIGKKLNVQAMRYLSRLKALAQEATDAHFVEG